MKLLILLLFIQHNTVNNVYAHSENKCSKVFDTSIQRDERLKYPSIRSTEVSFNEIVKEPLIEPLKEIVAQVSKAIILVPEFEFIRKTATEMGLRVWLFGGTASSFLHYVKWDLARSKGLMNLQKDRFDYDYTNIFRSTQDLDIVVDTTPEKAREFQNIIAEKFPHFLGAKTKWEVRTLHHRMGNPGEPGFKEALLNDSDFNNQDTDSNSLGMVELTHYKSEPIIRDLKSWDKPTSIFLEDTLKNQISFFRSPQHFTTSRAIAGENPEILSVIRLLVKAFQYELMISPKDLEQLKSIIKNFNGNQITNESALRRIHDTAKKLIIHAVNIEYAINKLDELGLRQKLIAMGDITDVDSDAWWLNREPLRSYPVGQGKGATAAELNISLVAHETNNFLAYESITRSHNGEPNVLISRQTAIGEAAFSGDGFYTRMGKEGARGTGLTIRFKINPKAREGSDFLIEGDYVIFKNKRALTVIQESLDFRVEDLLKMAESNEEIVIHHSDLALLEKLKRKLNVNKINEELNKLLKSKLDQDLESLIHILNVLQNSGLKMLLSGDSWNSISANIYNHISKKAHFSSDLDRLQYIKIISVIIESLDAARLLRTDLFFQYLKLITRDIEAGFELKKYSFYTLLTRDKDFENNLHLIQNFSPFEIKLIMAEMKEWGKSKDLLKVQCLEKLEESWIEIIKSDNITKIESWIESHLFNLNDKNLSEDSLLQIAEYYSRNKIINWLISNPQFDFNSKNHFGYNEVEQIRLRGNNALADEIQRLRRDVKSQKFDIRERNSDGSPIIDFVLIPNGSYKILHEKRKYDVTISKSFEIMSIHTTQKIWKTIVELANIYFKGKYDLNIDPSKLKGEQNPVEMVSYDDVSFWLQALNGLSKVDDTDVQNTLALIFPRHKKNDIYRLPTSAEWEFVARARGHASGSFSFSDSVERLGDYAWFYNDKIKNPNVHQVGEKKPIFILGKPIYDIHGNVWSWVADWENRNNHVLLQGIDPQGALQGKERAMRGGSACNPSLACYSFYRVSEKPNVTSSLTGFRIVRNLR